jgi:NAD(P)-dependent dehydrogenase (short-subunit alcohol dehydrogenase family)
MKLQDATVFITGANRGIGLAFARARTGTRRAQGLRRARDPDSVTLAGVVPVRLDVNNPSEAVAAAARNCRRRHARHQQRRHRAVRRLPGAERAGVRARPDGDQLLRPAARQQAFAPVLAANGGGALLNVLSVASWISRPQLAVYAASKTAAWSLSNGLRNELRPHGTQVLGLHMEGVEAGRIEVFADETTRQVKQGLSSATPPYASVPG